jgi:hypothetical protein
MVLIAYQFSYLQQYHSTNDPRPDHAVLPYYVGPVCAELQLISVVNRTYDFAWRAANRAVVVRQHMIL